MGILSAPVQDRFRAVLVGAYGEGNLGDDALMVANLGVLGRLYRPGEIALYCQESPYLAAMAPGVQVIPAGALLSLKGELVLYGGGTQFFSFPLTRAGFHPLRRLKRLLFSPGQTFEGVRRRLAPPRWDFARRAALGIGVGPFEPASREEGRAREVLSSFDFVAVRDPDSYRKCLEWGVPGVRLRADICFNKELWGMDPGFSCGRQTPRGELGIIVRDWPHSVEGAAYQGPLLEAARELASRGTRVSFVFFSAQGDRKWRELLRGEGFPLVSWDPQRHRIEEFVRRLTEYDLLVTARYHGAVLAATVNVPSVYIEIEPKLRLAAGLMNCSDLLWQQPFEKKALLDIVARALADYPATKQRILAPAGEQRARVESMVQEFLECVRQ